jgi:hypothetical protein
MDATSMPGSLPRVPVQNDEATVSRVHPKATLPRVQDTGQSDSTQSTQSSTTSKTTPNMSEGNSQTAQRRKPRTMSRQQPRTATPTTTPKTRAAAAREAALNAPNTIKNHGYSKHSPQTIHTHGK